MVVKVTFSKSGVKTLTAAEYSFTPTKFTTTGTQKLTITYKYAETNTTLTTTIDINVIQSDEIQLEDERKGDNAPKTPPSVPSSISKIDNDVFLYNNSIIPSNYGLCIR